MISSLLFERPITLAVICVGGEFLLLRVWSRRRTRFTARAAWTGAAASVALVAMSVAVATPRERINGICREIAKAVDEGDMDAVAASISPDFSTEGLDRDELVRRATQVLTRVRVDQVRLRHFDIEFMDERRATATFDTTCNVRTTDGFAGALPSRWKLSFRQDGQQWALTGMESIPVPPFRIKRLGDWLR